MAPLTNAQMAYLDARLEAHLEMQPEFAILVSRLLALGGVQVVAPVGLDPHLDLLLARGRQWAAQSRLQMAAPNACHMNAAYFYVSDPARYRIVTGYALSDDSLWRQHSWVYDTAPRKRLRTIETTAQRIDYYGVELTLAEAAAFMRYMLGPVFADSMDDETQ